MALEVGDGTGKRRPGDIFIQNDPPSFVDVAVIHPLAQYHLYRDQSSREPAPDHYARTVKDAKYKRPLLDAGLLFIPFVADVYGNLCESASLLVRKLAKTRAVRENMCPTASARLARIRLSFVIAHAVAKTLVPSERAPPPAQTSSGPSTRWVEVVSAVAGSGAEDQVPPEDDVDAPAPAAQAPPPPSS